jgi:predicted nucleotidyltransferase
MTTSNNIAIRVPGDRIKALCRKYHIVKLSLFGSELHGDSTPGRDVDLLVEFEDGHTPGFAFAALQRELSEMLGRNVDLHTSASLSRYFRSTVVSEARPVYEVARP